jgi:hypothetical protein
MNRKVSENTPAEGIVAKTMGVENDGEDGEYGEQDYEPSINQR